MAKKISPGQVLTGLPSIDWNEFCDAAGLIKRLRGGTLPPGSTYGANSLSVEVENTTSGDIEVDFPVLAIDGPVFNPDDRESVVRDTISLKGKTPDGDTTNSGFVIVQGPIGQNKFRPAVFRGLSWVRVEWTDEDHTHATVKSAENEKLESASSGIEIVWHQEVPGYEYLPVDLWALVNLGGGGDGGGAVFCVGVLTGTCAARGAEPEDFGSTSDYDVIEGSSSGALRNYSTKELLEGTIVVAVVMGGHMVILAAFC